jgi:hypothetical protein
MTATKGNFCSLGFIFHRQSTSKMSNVKANTDDDYIAARTLASLPSNPTAGNEQPVTDLIRDFHDDTPIRLSMSFSGVRATEKRKHSLSGPIENCTIDANSIKTGDDDIRNANVAPDWSECVVKRISLSPGTRKLTSSSSRDKKPLFDPKPLREFFGFGDDDIDGDDGKMQNSDTKSTQLERASKKRFLPSALSKQPNQKIIS